MSEPKTNPEPDRALVNTAKLPAPDLRSDETKYWHAETAGPAHYKAQHGITRGVSEAEAFIAAAIRRGEQS